MAGMRRVGIDDSRLFLLEGDPFALFAGVAPAGQVRCCLVFLPKAFYFAAHAISYNEDYDMLIPLSERLPSRPSQLNCKVGTFPVQFPGTPVPAPSIPLSSPTPRGGGQGSDLTAGMPHVFRHRLEPVVNHVLDFCFLGSLFLFRSDIWLHGFCCVCDLVSVTCVCTAFGVSC